MTSENLFQLSGSGSISTNHATFFCPSVPDGQILILKDGVSIKTVKTNGNAMFTSDIDGLDSTEYKLILLTYSNNEYKCHGEGILNICE